MIVLSSQQALGLVFAVIFVLLALASMGERGLKRRLAPHRPHERLDHLNARLKAWWALMLALALAVLLGRVGVVVLFAFLSFQCLREYLSVTRTRVNDHHVLLWCFYFFLPLQYVLLGLGWLAFFNVLIPVYAFLLLPISSALKTKNPHFLSRAAQVQWGLMICVYCLSCVPALMALPIVAGDSLAGASLVVFLLVVVQAGSVLWYLWGTVLGRYQASPEHVTARMFEGAAVWVGGSTVMGAAFFWLTPFAVWQTMLLALAASAAGFLGGFVLAAIKRDRGVKGWGNIVDGQGGVLDRIGALAFAAPVFYHAVSHFWGG